MNKALQVSSWAKRVFHIQHGNVSTIWFSSLVVEKSNYMIKYALMLRNNQILSLFAPFCRRESGSADIEPVMGLPLRHLNQGDKKWLENRVHDSRPEVAGLAKEVYRECFPHAERNAMKKQLVISELDFEIHTEVYQEYGDWETVD